MNDSSINLFVINTINKKRTKRQADGTYKTVWVRVQIPDELRHELVYGTIANASSRRKTLSDTPSKKFRGTYNLGVKSLAYYASVSLASTIKEKLASELARRKNQRTLSMVCTKNDKVLLGEEVEEIAVSCDHEAKSQCNEFTCAVVQVCKFPWGSDGRSDSSQAADAVTAGTCEKHLAEWVKEHNVPAGPHIHQLASALKSACIPAR